MVKLRNIQIFWNPIRLRHEWITFLVLANSQASDHRKRMIFILVYKIEPNSRGNQTHVVLGNIHQSFVPRIDYVPYSFEQQKCQTLPNIYFYCRSRLSFLLFLPKSSKVRVQRIYVQVDCLSCNGRFYGQNQTNPLLSHVTYNFMEVSWEYT